ncbi:MAG: hypothetical protein K9N23_06315 [Akkermansiaceae bacterium]|nr:hypothetical protein [Akkermansiaceae bacterium]MCF7731279.1 hypothetical protein [Akkermansiaceae bacterium]
MCICPKILSAQGRSVQKTLLYLGEINDSDRSAWTRAIEAVDELDHTRQIHLFPEDRTPDPRLEHPTLKLRLSHIELARPHQWGGCWLALELRKRDKLTRDDLLLAIGTAKQKAGRNAHRHVILHLPASGEQATTGNFHIELDRGKLKATRRHEGRICFAAT